MSDSVTLTFRGTVVEDFMTSATLAMTTAPVLGAGVVPVSPLVTADSDVSAAAAGVPVGGVYVKTGGATLLLAARMA
jgi:hypothetical protein